PSSDAKRFLPREDEQELKMSAGLNAGYVAQLLEDYLESPSSVAPEWRALFEHDGEALSALPGLQRLLELHGDGNGHATPAPVVPAPREAPAEAPPVTRSEVAEADTPVDELLLGGVAAAMALVKAFRMHGHLAARLDPLGSEPTGDPALDESRLEPALTPEL